MRFLKRLLCSIYIFLGAFTVICFVAWCITGAEPASLIVGVFGAAGVESICGGIIKIREAQIDAKKQESEKVDERAEPDVGGKD